MADAELACQMFHRWRQESFFKYLVQEYALDALVEYAAGPDDPNREVPHPAWAALRTERRRAYAPLERLEQE